MSRERTRELALAFARDPRQQLDRLADDAVFALLERDDETGLANGREVQGRAAIAGALAHFYGGGDVTRTTADEAAITDGRAMVEVAFYGRDLGRFFGLAAAPAPVLVPCEMIFTVEDDRITSGYLSFDLDALRRAVGARRA